MNKKKQQKQHHSKKADIESLVDQNYGLLVYLAKKFANDVDELEEYIQVGSIGMIKGINSFQDEKGKLSSYLSTCIRNELFRHIRYKKREKRYAKTVPLFNEHLIIETQNIEEWFPLLSSMERQIIDLYLENYQKKDIAAKLNISQHELYTKMKELFNKIREANEA